MLNHNGGPTKLPAKGGGQQQRPGKEEPLVGWRKEGASDHHQSWSQFLVGFIHPVWWHPPDDGRQCMVVAIPRLVSQFKKPALVVLVTTRALPLLPPRPLSPTSPLQAACSSCGVLSTTTTRRSLRTFSPRQSILKPEWRLWWPFRWQGILRGQVSEEATRDLP